MHTNNIEDKSRRDALIDEAAHLFRSKGYERTTVRDLAQAVGMQSGSLFYHFKNKAEILEAVMAQGVTEISQHATLALQAGSTPAERLSGLVRTHLKALLGNSQHALEVLLYEWHSLTPEARERVVKLRNGYEMLWQQALDDAATAGIIAGDTRLIRKMLLGSLNWTVQWFHTDGKLTIDQLADKILAQWLKQVAAV